MASPEAPRTPLGFDVLVADETSMIDVPLMHKLIQALPERAHLLIVGDVDQLPSVGPGSALADIIRSEVMMIVTLTAQRASFFHADQPTRPRRRQSNLEPRQRVKDTGRRDNCPRRPAVPPKTLRTWTTFRIAQGETVSADSPG